MKSYQSFALGVGPLNNEATSRSLTTSDRCLEGSIIRRLMLPTRQVCNFSPPHMHRGPARHSHVFPRPSSLTGDDVRRVLGQSAASRRACGIDSMGGSAAKRQIGKTQETFIADLPEHAVKPALPGKEMPSLARCWGTLPTVSENVVRPPGNRAEGNKAVTTYY